MLVIDKIKKYIKTLNLQKIKKQVKSKAFLGSVLFAASLWAYSSLNYDYKPLIKVPLTIKVPANKAIEKGLQQEVSIKVKGSGWQLFNLIFFNTSAKCVIDLTSKDLSGKEYIITRTDVLKGLENIVDVEPIDVQPESMKLTIGKMATYKVPVNPILSISPRPGFIAMSNIKIQPDSILITGNEKLIKGIKRWNTKVFVSNNLFKTTTFDVPLADSLKGFITLSQANVKITVKLQQAADITIYDVKLHIKGGSLPKGHKLQPKRISVVVHGGIEQIAKITDSDIYSYINYKDIMNDSTGIIIPKIQINENIDKAASGGDFLIWVIMFSILVIGVGSLAWINKDIER